MTDLSEHQYTKCNQCHLFVETNPAYEDDNTLAQYIHLSRGDDEDTAIEESHDAAPSGEKRTLAWWKANGPLPIRARFDVDLYEQTLRVQSLGLFDEYSTTALVEFITDGHRDLGTTTFRRDFEEWLETWKHIGHGKLITLARLDKLMPTV